MRYLLIIFAALIVVSSCKKIEDLNKNTKDPAVVNGESLFTGAQKNLFDQMITPNVNYNIFRMFSQHWTETTYNDEANYDLVTRTIPDNHWDVLYRDVLKNLTDAKSFITNKTYLHEAPEIKKNKLAIIEVMSIFTWSVLVESFGNIPYTEALNIENVKPKYDDASFIYHDLLKKLDVAISNLNSDFESLNSADNMYYGNVAKWIKFANSLKLKMGMVLCDVDPNAQAIVEAAALNVFTTSADNARIIYMNGAPNSNKIYDNLVASGRHDFVPANTLVDTLNNLNDPRLFLYFSNPLTFKYEYDDNNIALDVVVDEGTGVVYLYSDINGDDSIVYKVPPYTILASDTLKNIRLYSGGIYGAKNRYSKCSHVADLIQEPTFEGTIMDIVEVEFWLAEAAAKGWNVGGTESEHYDKAITASILYWGGNSADAATYLANPKVNYTTAAGDYKQKIGTQKWIALFNRGYEAWTEWRRLDFPKLFAPKSSISVIPLRLTYPVAEQTLNAANYQAASSAISGDFVKSKLFWDFTIYNSKPAK